MRVRSQVKAPETGAWLLEDIHGFCYTEKKHLSFFEAWNHIGRVYVRLFKAALGLDTNIFDIYRFLESRTGIVFSVFLCSVWLLHNGFSL